MARLAGNYSRDGLEFKAQRHRSTEVQRQRDSEVQRYKVKTLKFDLRVIACGIINSVSVCSRSCFFRTLCLCAFVPVD